MRSIKKNNTILAICFIIALVVLNVTIYQNVPPAEASTIKLNKSSVTLRVGNSTKLTLKGTSKKVTWSSNKKSVATVDKNGYVTAKKAGTAVIMANVRSKSYACVVKVKKNSTSNQSNNKQITYKQAEKIALKKVGGGVMTDIDLDYEQGILVYEIEVYYNGSDYDVVINAKTGKVISCHIDY